MAWQEQVLLPETHGEGCVTIHSCIEMDSLTAYRLKVAWSTALSALAVANDRLKCTPLFRIAQLQAQRAVDLYFEEVESSVRPI
jgi:hypothetical protein